MAMTRARRLFGRFNLFLSAVLALAIWAAATALATRPAFKVLVDLTPQAQFSVSDETRDLLDELRKRDLIVRIDTFYARLPAPRTPEERALVNIQNRVQALTTDLLVRYAELGGDHVDVHHYDLVRDIGPARARNEELGGSVQDNSVVVSIGKRHKVLQLALDMAEIDVPSARPSAAPGADRALPTLRVYKGEEALSTAIRSLLSEGTPHVYFLVGFEGEAQLTAGTADSYSSLLTALKREGFEIGMWNLEKEGRIPDDAAVVAALEPRGELSEQATRVLFDWIRGGGRFFLNTAWSPVPGPRWNPTFDALGQLCGFEIGEDLVCQLVPDPRAPNRPGVGGERAQNLLITDMAPHPITRPLARQNRYPQLKVAREVRPRSGDQAGVRVESLLRTGKWSWLAPRDPASEDAVLTPPNGDAAYGPRSVAIVSDIDNPGGPPGHVVVIGGLAFNNLGFQVNGDLALNVFNWAVKRTELVTVRGNRYRSNRLDPAPQQVRRAQALVQWWVPGALFLVGFAMFLIRRRRS